MRDAFVRPAELFEKDITESLCRICSETDIIGLRRLVYDYTRSVTVLPAVVTSEIYSIFGKDEGDRKRLFDFALTKMFSISIHDWVVDGDMTDGLREAQIAVKFLDEVASKRLAQCSPTALTYFVDNMNRYLEVMWDEKALQPTPENYMKNMEKSASLYRGMFGSAAIVGRAKRDEMRHVERFADSFYKASKLLDDISDYRKGETWNMAEIVGKEGAEDLQNSCRESAINHIKSVRHSKHVDYLVGIVEHLYQ